MREADAPSTEDVTGMSYVALCPPTGETMVAPPEISRNTQPGKAKAAPGKIGKLGKQRGQGQYKAGTMPADTSL